MLRLTRAQVREIDRRSIEEYHIPGIVLMENAARAVADVAWEIIGSRPAPVLVVCGGGNNGGDGLAAARHLANRGAGVEIAIATDPSKYKAEALTNWEIVVSMQLYRCAATEKPLSGRGLHALIIDALFGTGLSQAPRAESARVIDEMNSAFVPILAVDLPSGLDCDTGEPLGPCVRAHRTVTFVAEKAGFANLTSKQFTGEVTIGDIGCPRELIEEIAGGKLSTDEH